MVSIQISSQRKLRVPPNRPSFTQILANQAAPGSDTNLLATPNNLITGSKNLPNQVDVRNNLKIRPSEAYGRFLYKITAGLAKALVKQAKIDPQGQLNSKALREDLLEILLNNNGSSHILHMDLDGLKELNYDSGGDFPTGNYILPCIYHILEHIFKAKVYSPNTGDEYVILLENMSKHEVEQKAQRVLRIISNFPNFGNLEDKKLGAELNQIVKDYIVNKRRPETEKQEEIEPEIVIDDEKRHKTDEKEIPLLTLISKHYKSEAGKAPFSMSFGHIVIPQQKIDKSRPEPVEVLAAKLRGLVCQACTIAKKGSSVGAVYKQLLVARLFARELTPKARGYSVEVDLNGKVNPETASIITADRVIYS
jgi:GGDEF domain-containing protein